MRLIQKIKEYVNYLRTSSPTGPEGTLKKNMQISKYEHDFRTSVYRASLLAIEAQIKESFIKKKKKVASLHPDTAQRQVEVYALGLHTC